MKVLVTGGTGFVGRAIVNELLRAGHHVRLMTRSKPKGVLPNGVSVCTGHLLKSETLNNACTGIDAVIHLVGIISEAGDQTYENIHTRGTESIIAAAQKVGVKRFVHMSALGTRPNAVARYHKSKWAAEEIVRNSGLDWTIFRPSIIYGPGDGFVNIFERMSRFSPMLPLIGGGRSKFQPVPVESVAQCFVKSLAEPKSIAQTYELCGNEVLTLRKIIDEILSVTGRSRLKVPVPFAVAQLQATFLEFVCGRLLGKAPPLNRDQLLMLQEDNVGSARPARELFGLNPPSFEQGIAVYLNPERQ